MVGCWVALLFSLVDPHLWIFSSRHRHIHATDSAQKTIQEVDAQRSARERCSAGYRAAYACSSAVAASLLLMSSRCWPWPPCCVCMQQCRRRLTPSDVLPLLALATVLRSWTKRLANRVSQRAITDSGRERKRS